jgi:isopenicillin-N epimerase
VAPFLAVPAAISFLERHDWPAVRRRCHALLREARRAVGDLTGLPALSPDTDEWYAQMASLPLPLPPGAGPALQRRLYEEFAVEVPVVTWEGQTFVRVSVQGYNSRADIAALVAALRVTLPPVS